MGRLRLRGGGRPATPATPTGEFRRLKIGGGGYVTSIDVSDDGLTKVCRVDVTGAYVWNDADSVWDDLITETSFAGYSLEDRISGVAEVRVAPSDSDIIYMNYHGTIWKSVDRGATFAATGSEFDLGRAAGAAEANSGRQRLMGYKMVIHPTNPDIVYASQPQTGVWKTTNGGTSWSQISNSDIAFCTTSNGAYPGHPGMAIDPLSGDIYIPTYGVGVYRSQDDGATWTLLTSGPTHVCHGRIGADGAYYCSQINASTASIFYRYDDGVGWTNISSTANPQANECNPIVPDPNDANRVVCMDGGGTLQISTNRGGAWGSDITKTRNSDLIPWLEWTGETYMSAGNFIFDPLVADKIWFAQGIGVWTTSLASNPSSIIWDGDTTAGIENLVSNPVICPPNGVPLLTAWDRPVWRITDPETYPSTHGPSATASIRHGWSIDYASSDPEFIAFTCNYNNDTEMGFYSEDGGVNWTVFPGIPTGGNLPFYDGTPGGGGIDSQFDAFGSTIACASPLNWMICVPGKLPWYTLDGGSTWTEVVIAGMPTTGPDPGTGNTYTSRNGCLAADRVAANTFYYFNYRRTSDGRSPAYTGTQTLWRSTDGGVNWSQMNTVHGNIETSMTGANAFKMTAVPGHEGHLFLAAGKDGTLGQANPGGTKLWRSTDSGATWSRVGTTSGDGEIREPYTVGFGAPKGGAYTYPAVYFWGWLKVAGVYTPGLWRSYDECVTFENLGAWPIGLLHNVKDIAGSLERYGELYIAVGANSFVYRTAD